MVLAWIVTLVSLVPTTAPVPGKPMVYAWHSAAAEGLVPMLWVDPRFQSPGVAAAAVAAQWSSAPPGQRALFLYGLMQRNAVPNSPAELLRHGVATGSERKWCIELYALLRQRGLLPDRLVLDCEELGSIWHMAKDLPEDTPTAAPRARLFTRLYGDPDLRDKLPAALRPFQPSDFANHRNRGREAYIAWNDVANEITMGAVNTIAIAPFIDAFGAGKPASNYNDTNANRPLVDVNGWPIRGSTQRDVSSPDLYPGFSSEQLRLAKAPLWNRFIHRLNIVRACQATPGQRVDPWIGLPTYTGGAPLKDPWLWEQLVRHLAEGGVDTYLLFNPRPPPDQRELFRRWTLENQHAAAVLMALPVKAIRRDLPPIPDDADVVETGGVRTTYADFVARYGEGREMPR